MQTTSRTAVAALLAAGAAVASAGAQAAADGGEPDVPPAPYIRIDGQAPGEHLQVDFPAAAHAGISRSTYWLTGDEDLEIDVQLALGPGPVRPPLALTVVLVLDGRQQRFRVDQGSLVTHFERRVARVGEVHHFKLVVAGRSIAPGRHAAGLLLWKATSSAFPMWGFQVVKDDGRPTPRTASPRFRLRAAPPARGPSLVRWGRAPYPALLGRPGPVQPDRTGRLPLRLEVRRLDLGPWDERYTIVAFLDGTQVQLGALGRAPALQLAQGQLAEADLELSGARAGGGPHALVVTLLPELAASSTGPPPPANAGIPPLWIGGSSWGWQAETAALDAQHLH
jgi:hypothetical protein